MIIESIIHTDQTTCWLMHSLSIFGAQMSHKQTQTHKTHHGQNLKEASTFPIIVFFVPGHMANTQMSFCPEIFEIGTPATLEAHNFLCKYSIELRSKAKF
jgi:hypothetical protein